MDSVNSLHVIPLLEANQRWEIPTAGVTSLQQIEKLIVIAEGTKLTVWDLLLREKLT